MYGYVDSWLTNEQVVFILGCMIVHETIFWSYGLAFHLIRKYNWFEEYKLGNPPPDSLVKPMLLEVSFSHFVTQPIALWALYYVAKGSGLNFELTFDPLSSVFQFLYLSNLVDPERFSLCDDLGRFLLVLGTQIVAPTSSVQVVPQGKNSISKFLSYRNTMNSRQMFRLCLNMLPLGKSC